MEKGVVYRSEEAKEMFKAPQFSTIRGGVVGLVNSFGLLAEKLGRGLNRDFLNSLAHSTGGNVLLNEGINQLWTILCTASSGTKFDNTNAYLGVGDDATGEDPVQTGLIAVTNKLYVAMDGGFPTYGTSQQAAWRSTFTSAQANYDWREFTVANGSSNTATNLNRKVSSQGTKASGQQWQLTLTITLA